MQSSISFFDAQTRKKTPIKIGSGTYNDAYFFPLGMIKDESGSMFPPMVFKLPKATFSSNDLKINDAARQFKKWNAINPQYRDYVKFQDGYRMLINHPIEPLEITKGILYLSCAYNKYLQASYMLDNGLVEHRLFVNAQHVVTAIVNGALPLSIEYQNYIFSLLKLPRQSILVPQIVGKSGIPDVMLARAVLKIYLETRCIIADACTNGNFLYDHLRKEIICVDFDHAMHRDSPVSHEIANHLSLLECETYAKYWNDCKRRCSYHQTVMVIRALFYLEAYLCSELVKNEYLRVDFMSVIYDFYKQNSELTPQLCIDILSILVIINHPQDAIVSKQTLQELKIQLLALVLLREDEDTPGNSSIDTNESFMLLSDASASAVLCDDASSSAELPSISALSDSGLFSIQTTSPFQELDAVDVTPNQSSTETLNL